MKIVVKTATAKSSIESIDQFDINDTKKKVCTKKPKFQKGAELI